MNGGLFSFDPNFHDPPWINIYNDYNYASDANIYQNRPIFRVTRMMKNIQIHKFFACIPKFRQFLFRCITYIFVHFQATRVPQRIQESKPKRYCKEGRRFSGICITIKLGRFINRILGKEGLKK